jgi:hypothetical protein
LTACLLRRRQGQALRALRGLDGASAAAARPKGGGQEKSQTAPATRARIIRLWRGQKPRLGEIPAWKALLGRRPFGKPHGVWVCGGLAGNRASVPLVAAMGTSVWSLNPFKRGVEIEKMLGQNLPANFPVIDKFTNGLATSIKSIDLNAASYQNIATLNRTMTGYIDSVANFNGRTWAGVNVSGVTARALELAVPPGASAAQLSAINAAVRYGASVGVTVTTIVIP